MINDPQGSGLAFFFVVDETPDAVVDRFTIVNGNDDTGGAVFFHHDSRVTVCRLHLREQRLQQRRVALHRERQQPDDNDERGTFEVYGFFEDEPRFDVSKDFQILAGDRVLYRADQDADEVLELVLIAGRLALRGALFYCGHSRNIALLDAPEEPLLVASEPSAEGALLLGSDAPLLGPGTDLLFKDHPHTSHASSDWRARDRLKGFLESAPDLAP